VYCRECFQHLRHDQSYAEKAEVAGELNSVRKVAGVSIIGRDAERVTSWLKASGGHGALRTARTKAKRVGVLWSTWPSLKFTIQPNSGKTEKEDDQYQSETASNIGSIAESKSP
jgi:hypothetical protein